jgi:hypothetical protein
LADRVLREKADEAFEKKLVHAFNLVLQRDPKSVEIEHLRQTFDERLAGMTEVNAKMIIDGASTAVKPKSAAENLELAAWFYIANILLNLDETISKG